jgi:hypothetical protein
MPDDNEDKAEDSEKRPPADPGWTRSQKLRKDVAPEREARDEK